MKGEISIKLKDGAIPHIEPVRRVPHAMQEPLKAELDKLVEGKILDNVNISKPIKWLNVFVCVKKTNGKNQAMFGCNTFKQMNHQAST